MKAKKRKLRLEARRQDYERMIKDSRTPEAYTKPGSLNK